MSTFFCNWFFFCVSIVLSFSKFKFFLPTHWWFKFDPWFWSTWTYKRVDAWQKLVWVIWFFFSVWIVFAWIAWLKQMNLWISYGAYGESVNKGTARTNEQNELENNSWKVAYRIEILKRMTALRHCNSIDLDIVYCLLLSVHLSLSVLMFVACMMSNSMFI